MLWYLRRHLQHPKRVVQTQPNHKEIPDHISLNSLEQRSITAEKSWLRQCGHRLLLQIEQQDPEVDGQIRLIRQPANAHELHLAPSR